MWGINILRELLSQEAEVYAVDPDVNARSEANSSTVPVSTAVSTPNARVRSLFGDFRRMTP